MGKRNQKGGKGPLPHVRSRTTRSSRGRLIPLQPTPSLPDQLRLLGLYAAPTLGDGNCLFRALADQVYGSPVRHAEVRREVCDWIEKWGERYEGFVEFEGESGEEGRNSKRKGKGKDDGDTSKEAEKEGKSRRLQAYLGNMRENGTYGGHMELSAFAHMTRRNIKVVQPGLVYVIEWRAGSGSGTSTSATSSTSTSVSAPVSTKPASSPSLSSSNSTSPPPPHFLPDGRRLTRSTSGGTISDKFDKIQKKNRQSVHAQGKRKVKTGRHGYYVLEEVSSDDEDGEEGDGEGVEGGEREETVEVKEEEVAEVKEEVHPVEVQQPQDQVQLEEEEEDGGPTIYVAYHDWEHFSSIRNLRGPHTGLPNIQETPAYDYADADPSAASISSASAPPSLAMSEKEALKEKEREKKRERERKEKEREKERRDKGAGALKVKLKLGGSSASTPRPASSGAATPASTPAPASAVGEMVKDPALVPLPTSRSASPFMTVSGLGAMYAPSPLTSLSSLSSIESIECPPPSQATEPPQSQTQAQSQSTVESDIQPSQTSSSSPHHDEQLHVHSRHTHLQVAARTQHRSPKRSFDESSASGGDGEDSEKRSRRRVGSTCVSVTANDVAKEEDMDVDVDVEGDGGDGTGTPALSAPGTSSSSSETSSEVASELSSPPASVSPSPPPDIEVVSPSASVPPLPLPPTLLDPPKSPLSPGKLKKRFPQHQHHVQGEKSLTRRQRKVLGLPKARAGMHVNASVGGGGSGKPASAGKIVIPGGRWTGAREASAPAVVVGGAGGGGNATETAEEEWRRNGTGRLDVRGFRELKI